MSTREDEAGAHCCKAGVCCEEGWRTCRRAKQAEDKDGAMSKATKWCPQKILADTSNSKAVSSSLSHDSRGWIVYCNSEEYCSSMLTGLP